MDNANRIFKELNLTETQLDTINMCQKSFEKFLQGLSQINISDHDQINAFFYKHQDHVSNQLIK